MPSIDSLTIDLHRLGSLSEEGVIRCDERYIALTGSEAPPVSCEMRLGHEEFLQRLHGLRYPRGIAPEQIREALQVLGGHAARLLPHIAPPPDGHALQVDLVLGAAELWAFPFEACTIDGSAIFADGARPLILTRRIRQGFAAEKRPWPVRPRVLFLHAPVAGDLSSALVERHVASLEQALLPWSAKGDPRSDDLLQVELALGIGDVKRVLQAAREANAPFTHVHLLAHGKAMRDPVTDALRWGMRLGDEVRAASDPVELAESLRPVEGLPVIVTVAACDAANQAETAIPKKSFAQELHRCGLPVVLASQLPLTQNGSVTMTQTFYHLLLRGEDARWALHATRLALRNDQSAGHDWVSLVGYVQLPEGYADHLMEVGVKRDMELLKAARRRLDALLDVEDGLGVAGADTTNDEPRAAGGEQVEGALDGIEREVGERIASLEQHLRTIPEERKDLRSECHGILASAHKRLADLFFRRGRRAARTGNAAAERRYEQASRSSLETSLASYRAAYRANIQNHWLGVQQLALEAVLRGGFEEPRDWETTYYSAELATAQNNQEYWAHGTFAELWLLRPLLEKPRAIARAKEALGRLQECAASAGDSYAVPSTRDQLLRYVVWWTKDHGFFADRGDLSLDARELLQHLSA